MRIANLLPAGYTEGYEPPAHLLPESTSVEQVMMKLPALPTCALDLAITEIAAVEAAIRARDAGFDAIFINSVADYGLRAIRSAVQMPVVGAGQASMLLACALGDRFSIVSVLPPSLRECHDAQLRAYGLTERCVSMRFVTSAAEMAQIAEPDSWYARMRTRRADMVERIGRHVQAAVEEDGADVVILGCTCMVPIAKDVQAYTSAPVINPLDAAYLQAEMLVRMGISHSPKRFRPSDIPRDNVLQAIVDGAEQALAQQLVDSVEPCDDTCEILAGTEPRVAV
jgi:allantoin racemase